MPDNGTDRTAVCETAADPNQQPVEEVSVAPAKRTTAPALPELVRTRLSVHAENFIILIGIRGYTPADVGVFTTLVAISASRSIPDDDKAIGKLIGCPPHFVRHARELIDAFFVASGGALVRSDESPIQARLMGTLRQPVAHHRQALLSYWGEQCVYCGKGDIPLAIEHITPLARGGTNDISNLTLACKSCNSRKATKTAAEFGYPELHTRALGVH